MPAAGHGARLIHSIAPNYLLPGGDTQYTPTFVQSVQPTAAEFTGGYDASWGQLQNPSSPNYVPGLVVRPTPGDHEYGDAAEDDRGADVERLELLRQLRARGFERPSGRA